MRTQEDLALWRCDRCGEFVKPYTLCVLPNEWPAPLADAGDFCPTCCALPLNDWLTWFREQRPGPSRPTPRLTPLH